MKNLIKFLSLILMILFFNPKTTIGQCHIDDWNALKALYESTNGYFWFFRAGWHTMIDDLNSPPANCDLNNLFGVSTENGRVTCIDMDGEANCNLGTPVGNNLAGTIPSEMGNLSNLFFLRLSYNRLTGGLPIELQNLSNLTYLHLENNQLSGQIPSEIGNFISLDQLLLDKNDFEGPIPTSIGNLTNLTFLDLADNPLTGSIPTSIGNLNNLVHLDISSTNINSIPLSIGNLTNLEELYLTNNPQLNETIPSQFGSLLSLKVLNLNANNFTGNIPSEIGNLTSLEVFDVNSNDLSGDIPPSFANLTNLTSLSFAGNNFEGNVLDIVVNLPNLEIFQANYNQFTGTIPSSIGNLTQLQMFLILWNNFSGSLPSELGNLNLLTFWIGHNQFDGCYPNNLSNLCSTSTNNGVMSRGNNFDADWEDFCATGAGACDPIIPNTTNVWPGDKNHDGIVDQKDVSIIGFLYETGPPRASEHQNTDWYGHPCEDWDDNLPFNGANIKHLDCNGDGTISTTDADAVIDNLGLTHDEGNNQIFTPFFEETNYQIYLQPIDDLDDNNLLQVNVVLESKNGNSLNLQGGYFTIDYNNINTNITNAAMNFPNSWLGINDINMITSYQNFPNNNQIEIGFSKTNGTNSTGKGIIGQLTFVLDNNAMRTANGLLDFEVIEIGVHDSQGNIQPIEEQLLQVGLNESNCEPSWTITEDSPFYNVYKSNGTIATDGFVLVGNEQQVQYSANRVRFKEGFSVRAGADFKVRYVSCN